MLKMTKQFLSLVLMVAMLSALLPAGTVVLAAEEDDTTLSDLHYTFHGATQAIELTSDNTYSALQENRYTVTLPYITKTFASDRMPQVTAIASTDGAVADVTQITAFPGTVKIAVTSSNTRAKRNYYVRFCYEPGEIGAVTNKVTERGNVYKAFHDLQPMSLSGLRELYQDVGNGWENYCRAYVDRNLSATGNAIVNDAAQSGSDKIPSTLVPLQTGKVGDYVDYYQKGGSSYFSMWMATGTSAGNSSDFFNGASWIATGNEDKATAYMKGSYNDAVSFTIDRGATVWIALQPSKTSTNFTANGWTYTATSGYKFYHGDGSDGFKAFFTKHFDAGQQVNIPTFGPDSSMYRMYMPIIMWDAPGNGVTSLNTLTATYNGTDHAIPIVPNQTVYYIQVPSVPTFKVTLTDTDAESDIIQSTAASGSATITVTSGSTTTVYTVNYTGPSTDASLKTLSYTHTELGLQNVVLTPGVHTYAVELPYGLSSEIPQVTGLPNDALAAITSTVQAASIPGTATIAVQAEDGTQNTYTIAFTQAQTPPPSGVGTVTNLKYRGVAASGDFKAVTGVQATAPIDIYNDSVNYPTQAAKIAAATDPTVNLYKNNALRMYSDRAPEDNSGSVLGSRMEFSYAASGESATSPEFLSPNVTRILTKNDEKDKTDSIPNAYSFTIDKPATVYIATNYKDFSNILNSGWALDTTGLQIARTSYSSLQYTEGESADSKNYAIPDGRIYAYTGVYTKHYAAGANVNIPSVGDRSGGRGSGLVVLLRWDTVENQTITSLSLNTPHNLNQTYGATSKVTFRATATPSADVDRSTIEWYVNGVKQNNTGADFSYTPTEIGKYVISVQVSNNEAATVDAKTIVVARDMVYGDVNGDDIIDISDVIMAAEIAVGTPGYTDAQKIAANVSSKIDMTVDISDVVLIAERAVGGTTPFPIEEEN